MLNMVYPALSAVRVLGQKVGVIANNLANVNTPGFKKSRTTIQEGMPSGVQSAITEIDTPGSPLPIEEGTGINTLSSNVAMEEEIPALIETARAYTANIKSAKAGDEILGRLFDVFA